MDRQLARGQTAYHVDVANVVGKERTERIKRQTRQGDRQGIFAKMKLVKNVGQAENGQSGEWSRSVVNGPLQTFDRVGVVAFDSIEIGRHRQVHPRRVVLGCHGNRDLQTTSKRQLKFFATDLQ